jgi:hypothetical protein
VRHLTLLTGLAVGAYRHARRGGAPLPYIHQAIDRTLTGHYDDDSFATGILAALDTATGRLEWTCAGHPPPLLLRGRRLAASRARQGLTASHREPGTARPAAAPGEYLANTRCRNHIEQIRQITPQRSFARLAATGQMRCSMAR